MNKRNRSALKTIINCHNFNSSKNITEFKEEIESIVEDWDPFTEINWKEVIKYPISNRKNLNSLKIGKHFKENGILNFIVSGMSFGFHIEENFTYYNAVHGIMVLEIENERIYCYYFIDMGGCATCTLATYRGNPVNVKLYMSDDLLNVVDYCMSLVEIDCAVEYFKH